MSVGTREQLSTLVRVALAEQLQSVLVLDDQLVQSDPARIEWFQELLRQSVRQFGHQIVVLTCRPDDYLRPGEFPAADQPFRDTTDEVRAINLPRLMR